MDKIKNQAIEEIEFDFEINARDFYRSTPDIQADVVNSLSYKEKWENLNNLVTKGGWPKTINKKDTLTELTNFKTRVGNLKWLLDLICKN